jgi:hypothetical protein
MSPVFAASRNIGASLAYRRLDESRYLVTSRSLA